MSRIEKTIARQKQRISEGQYYEAHQQLRVIASRYLKSNPPNYNAAIDILNSGAQALFAADQGGSGGDLCIYLMDSYKQAEKPPDAVSKGTLLGLARAFPKGEPSRKRFLGDMIGWSAKFGEYPAGDPEIHHVAGQLYAEDGDPYEAERHLALGTRDSVPLFVRLEYDWYATDEPSTAATYAARAVFPLLLAGNLRGANQALLLFISRLSSSNPSLGVQEVTSSTAEVKLISSLPLLNFLSQLLLAIQRAHVDLFKSLKSHYASYLRETEGKWDEALEHIGEAYFGIRAPRQSNPLMDMMGSMLGGGMGGGSGGAPKRQRFEAPAPAPAVD